MGLLIVGSAVPSVCSLRVSLVAPLNYIMEKKQEVFLFASALASVVVSG